MNNIRNVSVHNMRTRKFSGDKRGLISLELLIINLNFLKKKYCVLKKSIHKVC